MQKKKQQTPLRISGQECTGKIIIVTHYLKSYVIHVKIRKPVYTKKTYIPYIFKWDVLLWLRNDNFRLPNETQSLLLIKKSKYRLRVTSETWWSEKSPQISALKTIS